jgi:hypothetical protein
MKILCDTKLVVVYEVPHLTNGCESSNFKVKAVKIYTENLNP